MRLPGQRVVPVKKSRVPQRSPPPGRTPALFLSALLVAGPAAAQDGGTDAPELLLVARAALQEPNGNVLERGPGVYGNEAWVARHDAQDRALELHAQQLEARYTRGVTKAVAIAAAVALVVGVAGGLAVGLAVRK